MTKWKRTNNTMFCPFSFGHCIVCPFSFGHCIVCSFVLFLLVIVLFVLFHLVIALFVLFLLANVLSVLLYTDSDYSFAIFKLFLVRWEAVDHFVDIGGNVHYQCLNFLFIRKQKMTPEFQMKCLSWFTY
jgi:hypothetical protein